MAIEIPQDWPNRNWVEDTPVAYLESIDEDAAPGTEPTRWKVSNWSTTREIRSSALPGQVRHTVGLSIGTGSALLKREGNDYPWKKGLVYELTGQDAQILLAPEGRSEIPTGQFRVADVSGDTRSVGVQVELDEKQIEGTDSKPGVLGEQYVSSQQVDDIYFDPIWLVEQLALQMGYGVRVEPGGTLPDGSTYEPFLDIPFQGSMVPAHPAGADFTEFSGDEGHFEAMGKGKFGYAPQPVPWKDEIVALAPRPGNSRAYIEYNLNETILSKFTLTADVLGQLDFNWNGSGSSLAVFGIEVETFTWPDSETVDLRLYSSGSNGTLNTTNSMTLDLPIPEDRPFGIQVEVEVTQTGMTWSSARARIRRPGSAWSGWLTHTMTNTLNAVDDQYDIQVQTVNTPYGDDTDGRLARFSIVSTESTSQQDAILQATSGSTGRIYLEPLIGTSVSPWLDPDLNVWATMQAIVEAWQGALITDVYGDLRVLNRYSLVGVLTGEEKRIDAGMRFEDIPWIMNFADQADRLVLRYRPVVERKLEPTDTRAFTLYEFPDVIVTNPGNNDAFFTLDYIYPLDLKHLQFVRKDFDNGIQHVWDAYRYNNGTGAHMAPGTDIAMRIDRVTSSTWKVLIVNLTGAPFYMIDNTGAPWLKIRSMWYFDQTQEQFIERGLPANEAKNAMEIDLGHYVQNAEDANLLADFIWGRVRYRSWRAATINTVPDYRADLGDVVEVVHSRTGMRSNALVTKVDLAGAPGSLTQKIDLILIPPTWEDFDEAWSSVAGANSRFNRSTNPSIEVNATGWESNSAFGGYDVATVQRALTPERFGTASLRVTAPPPVVGSTWGNFTSVATVAGRTYTFSMYVYSETEATFYADAVFVNRGPDTVVSPGVWTRVSTTFVANSSGTFCGVGIDGAPEGFVYYIDGALLEESASVGDYFDGSTTDTAQVTYSWAGTANASVSVATPANPGNTWDAFDALWDAYTWVDFDRTPTATSVAQIEEAM